MRLGLLGARERAHGRCRRDGGALGRRRSSRSTPATLAGADLIIDALFGAGLSRPLEGVAAEVVAAINASGKPVLAVDVPSGLDGTTGAAGGPVVQATRTVTFFRLKPGHLLLPGRRAVRRGAARRHRHPRRACSARSAPRTFANRPALWRAAYPRPRLDAHKYTRGHAVVVSGPAESTGAARLGARGALRIGAGLVTLVGSGAATAINATHCTAVMVRAIASDAALAEFLADERRNAVLIGPGAGVGAATAASVLTVLALGRRRRAGRRCAHLVRPRATEAPVQGGRAWASSCAAPSPDPATEALFDAIKAREAPVVLTPHEGEFKRLFGELAGLEARARAPGRRASAAPSWS